MKNKPIRLLNRDGALNIEKDTLRTERLYSYLLAISWQRFLFYALLAFAFINAVFTCIYLLIGRDCLSPYPTSLGNFGSESGLFYDFIDVYFFSTQTFTTVGYGHVHPICVSGNIVASIESFTGWIFFAVITGLFYAKFTRPTIKLKLSDVAVIDHFLDSYAFKFMIANEYENKLVDVAVTLDLIKLEIVDNRYKKRFYHLPLIRDKIPFLSVPWTVVHPIDDRSPLKNLTFEDFQNASIEFFVQIKVFDEAHSQVFFKEYSYFGSDEILWGHKFVNIQRYTERGALKLSMKRFGKTTSIENFPPQL